MRFFLAFHGLRSLSVAAAVVLWAAALIASRPFAVGVSGQTPMLPVLVTPSGISPPPPPVLAAHIVNPPTNVERGVAVGFASSASPGPNATIQRYHWDFGDGDSTDGPSVSHSFARAGGYNVRLAVTDSSGATARDSAQILVSTTTVGIPGSAAIAAGDAVQFYKPPAVSLSSPPSPGQPLPVCTFCYVPTSVIVVDDSDQAASVAYGDSGLGVSVPDGFIVRLSAADTMLLHGCAAIDGQANEIGCGSLPIMSREGEVLITVADAGSGSQSLAVGRRSSAALNAPPSGNASAAPLETVTLENQSDQAATVDWDGATLSIAVPDGLAPSIESARSGLQVLSAGDVGCAPADQPTVIACVLTVTPVELNLTTVLPAPAGTLTLPYADSSTQGTLTITNAGPEAAPGGARVAVTLDDNLVVLTGQGVVRPRQFPASSFLLLFNLSDLQGDSFLVEGSLVDNNGAWSAEGLWLSTTDPTQADSWSAGALSGDFFFVGPQLSTVVPGPATGAPLPGPALPLHEGGQLFLAVPLPGPLVTPDSAPTVGAVGQAVGLMAVSTPPCCGPNATQTWQWFFGDGASTEPGKNQMISHAWSSPGVYTVSVVVTDSTGISIFASTRVGIVSAGP